MGVVSTSVERAVRLVICAISILSSENRVHLDLEAFLAIKEKRYGLFRCLIGPNNLPNFNREIPDKASRETKVLKWFEHHN